MFRKRSEIPGKNSVLHIENQLMRKLLFERTEMTGQLKLLSKTLLLNRPIFLIAILFLLSGCMHMSMRRGHKMMKPMNHGASNTVQMVNK